MAGITIRPFAKGDEPVLVDLWYRSAVAGHPFVSESFWDSQREGIRQVFFPAATTWVAEEGGRIAGFISLIENLIADLFVEPDRQGLGIGSALILHVRSIYRGSLFVEVFERNRRAMAFYKKRGFVFHHQEVQEETGEVLVTLVVGR